MGQRHLEGCTEEGILVSAQQLIESHEMAETGSFADRVKQQADIVRVVGEYVRLKKSGQNFSGLCPFHSEKTPSFAVHPVKQIYHFFGCGVVYCAETSLSS